MLARIVNREEASSAQEALLKIRESVTAPTKIAAFTHNFYKYPACFPETFPRSVIRSFSNPGDWILDPFLGGGTSAVEALASKRNFVGLDINDLAIFSSRFKTALLDNADFMELNNLSSSLALPPLRDVDKDVDQYFFQNVPKNLANFVLRAKSKFSSMKRPRAQLFCTGVLLRTMQLELEREIPLQSPNLEDQYLNLLDNCIEKNLNFQRTTGIIDSKRLPSVQIFKADLADPWGLDNMTIRRELDLAITSPPYPQRHILYSKWQIKGRAETHLPYWIIDSDDRHTPVHYAMGGRDSQASLEIYLTSIHTAYANVNRIMKRGGIVVQVVAFNDIKKQFFGYLDAMNAAGFEEIKGIDRSSYDGRLWRTVPNQKWYNRYKLNESECREVVLFHYKKRTI